MSAKISGQNQYADGADGSSIIIQPDRKNNDSEEKEKTGLWEDQSERPKKVDKNRKGILFFLDLEPFICGFYA